MTMKRFLGSALALLALIGCSGPGGGESGPPALMSVRAETAKTLYILGQNLEPDTITVTGTYSDGTTAIIPVTDAVISGYDPNRAGDQTITVTVEGKSAAFTVTVTGDTDAAKDVLAAALEYALNTIEDIVLSDDGSDVPLGVPWLTPAQKQDLDDAIEAARNLIASGNPEAQTIVAALEALEKAAEQAAGQTGTKTDWSYTVRFDANGGEGDPVSKTVTSPATTAGSLPANPGRSGYAFEGWNTRADGSGSAFTGTSPVVADITVYAQWRAVIDARSPVISVQPRDGAYTVGAAAEALSVTAASPDGGELSYQWHSAVSGGTWAAIEGAVGSTYTPSTAAAGAVSYYVRVTNTNEAASGVKTASASSAPVTITVTAVNALAPDISGQPRDGAYTVGAAAEALSVTAASPDGGELSYQWHSAVVDGTWTAIEEATGPTYTPSTEAVGIVSYYVRVTNTNEAASGVKTASASSSPVTITVTAVHAQAPVISVQPRDGAYTVGAAAAALSVTAASPDGGVLSYQWHSIVSGGSWTAIEGAVGSTYTPSTAAAGAVSYYVRVTNTNEAASGVKTASANSSAATITVTVVNARAPVISVQPGDATYAINAAAAALSVTAASPDGGELSYQWFSIVSGGSWTAIEGAVAASYMPPTGSYGSIGYYVRVTNTNNSLSGVKTAAVNSGIATVTVARVNAQAPVIRAQPQNAAYLPGATAEPLSVLAEAADGGTLGYQWYSRGDAPTGEWELIPAATAPSYTPSTAGLGKFYYYVQITNTNTAVDGATTAIRNSNVVTVKVTTVGSGRVIPVGWATDNNGLVVDAPEIIDISRGFAESFTIETVSGLDNLQWFVDGSEIPGSRGTAQSITIEAANYAVGRHTLGLDAEKDGVPYSVIITFMVDN